MTQANSNPNTTVQWPELPAIPEAVTYSDEALGKLENMAALLQLNLDVSPRELVKQMRQAVDVAVQYQAAIDNAKRGQYRVKLPEASGAVVKMGWHDRVATDAKLGRTVAVRGPAGNGKSIGTRSVLEALGYTVYHLDCTDSTTAEMLVGGLYPVTKDGGLNMEWKDGLFAKAFGDEKAAIQLDEFDALDPRIGMVLQSALHRARAGDTRHLSCADHPAGEIKAKGDCPVVVTMNTYGTGATREYVGRNVLDAASLDRFDSVVDTDYENELEILKAAGCKVKTAKEITVKAKELRAKIADKNLRIILSTRRLLNMAESIDKLGLEVDQAVSRDFTARLEPLDRQALGLTICHGEA